MKESPYPIPTPDLDPDTAPRLEERRRDSFFHEFRGTGLPQVLLGAGELLVPVFVLLRFDEVSRELGFGLWGALALIVVFGGASMWRALRRRSTRRRIEEERRDPIDLAEEVEDHWTDFFRAAALLLVLWAMIPTTTLALETERDLLAAVFVVIDGLLLTSAGINAWEGIRRLLTHRDFASGRLPAPLDDDPADRIASGG